ncbi:MAG TPA: F0F1 ATP synthase subunit gamma [Myxococcota bacterium]|nr:F0F1 ATP synthase subunit gamma [Myxococcota bacterium]
MAGTKEIRNKIKSVQSTRKITKAMEMVAASKMKKAQDRMRQTRPYVSRIWQIAGHLSKANPEYKHPFIVKRDTVKNVGLIIITTDKGLCGGLNTNALRVALTRMREWQGEGKGVIVTAIGTKGLGFMQRLGANVASHAVQIGDRPQIDRLVGPVKIQLDAYRDGKIDQLFILTTRFVNTMKQEPMAIQALPLVFAQTPAGNVIDTVISEGQSWDYIYEPDAKAVLDGLLTRYIEALIYQAVVENMASEQSARMVAMKAASDNAADIINELTLVLNKTRQAAITKELAEIVGGAAAV